VTPKVLSPEEEVKQKQKLDATPYVQPWQIDVVSNCLPFLADKPTIKRALEAAKGNIDAAVSTLMDAEEHGSGSSAQESSSVERDQDSDDDTNAGPNKKQDRRLSRATKKSKPRSSETRHALSQQETADGSQDSVASSTGEDSEASTIPQSSQQSTTTTQSTSTTAPSRPPIRLKLRPPKPPPDYQPKDAKDGRTSSEPAGKTTLSQPGPRISARDKKDIKKQAQKAARKERQQQASTADKTDAAKEADASNAGLSLRKNGLTQTPPVETLRTLYI